MKNHQRNKEVMTRHQNGETYGKIAADMGITRSIVAGIIYRNRSTEPDAGKAASRRGSSTCLVTNGDDIGTVTHMAEKHGLSYRAAYARAYCGYKGWTFYQ